MAIETTAAGGALALGTVTLTGSIFGLEYDTLLKIKVKVADRVVRIATLILA